MEEITLNLGEPQLNVVDNNDVGTIKIHVDSPNDTPVPKGGKSVNFGPGADMLMNPNKKSNPSSPKTDIKLTDLDELNSLNLNEPPKKARPKFSDVTSNIFQKPTVPVVAKPAEKPPTITPLESAVQKEKTSTNDGFKTFKNIPISPDAPPAAPKMSPQQELREKLGYLRKLEALEKRGITLTKKYTMDSPLDEMKGEYEMIKADKEKKNSIKFQQKMLLAFVSGLEFLNNKFDPFDLKLDGWSEGVNENIDEYDEVFGELHEKYGDSAKMAPELKLLFMLGGSAAMLHMTNTMFKSSMPGMDDIMRQNPELMAQFQSAAMNSMGQSNPGFSQFMGGVMDNNIQPPRGAPRAPPDDMRINPPSFVNNSSRPDFDVVRERNDGINVKDNYKRVKTRRAEMKGPSDLDDILSGLKTKKINISNQKDSNSVVSIDELKEMKGSLEKPKKSRRKPKSERNTVSLNL